MHSLDELHPPVTISGTHLMLSTRVYNDLILRLACNHLILQVAGMQSPDTIPSIHSPEMMRGASTPVVTGAVL